MICYICHRYTVNSFSHQGIGFGYCKDHEDDIRKGVTKFIISDNLNYINDKKKEFYYKYNQLDIIHDKEEEAD